MSEVISMTVSKSRIQVGVVWTVKLCPGITRTLFRKRPYFARNLHVYAKFSHGSRPTKSRDQNNFRTSTSLTIVCQARQVPMLRALGN